MIVGKTMGTFEGLVGHVIDLDFDTHEAMIEAALLWQLEEYQMDSGFFRGSMNAVHTSHIQIASTSRSNGVFIKGQIPQNTYLFASIETEGKMTHNGVTILDDELVFLTENDQLDFVVSSAEDDVTIAIDKNFFDHGYEKHFNEPFQSDTNDKRIQLKEGAGPAFRDTVKEMVAALKIESAKLQNFSDFHAIIEQEILQIVFQNIELSQKRQKTLVSETNANKVRNHIEMNYTKDNSISEICSMYNFSERTIRLSFKNLFGLSPKQYHKYYALGKVHHAFLKGNISSDTVERIAYDHGFSHMGRFSSNYKAMFGNTPSTTLRKSLIS